LTPNSSIATAIHVRLSCSAQFHQPREHRTSQPAFRPLLILPHDSHCCFRARFETRRRKSCTACSTLTCRILGFVQLAAALGRALNTNEGPTAAVNAVRQSPAGARPRMCPPSSVATPSRHWCTMRLENVSAAVAVAASTSTIFTCEWGPTATGLLWIRRRGLWILTSASRWRCLMLWWADRALGSDGVENQGAQEALWDVQARKHDRFSSFIPRFAPSQVTYLHLQVLLLDHHGRHEAH
jgi:hypothetical protein